VPAGDVTGCPDLHNSVEVPGVMNIIVQFVRASAAAVGAGGSID
jgi:hypothetical protein